MAISTISGVSSTPGFALARHGNGILYFLCVTASGLTMYGDVDGSPTSVDSETATTVHGGGSWYGCDMAIDGDNVIHIVSQGSGAGTEYVVHGTFDPVTDTFNNDWTEVIAFDQAIDPPSHRLRGCSIAIANNGDIHIVAVVTSKVMGQPQEQVIHNFYNGTAWDGETQVNTLTTNDAWNPQITAYGSDGNEMMCGYYQSIYAYYRPWTSGGGWGTENVYNTQDFPWDTLDICVSEDGANHYLAYVLDTINQDVEVNGVDTLANPNSGQPEIAIGYQGGVQYLYVAASAGGIQLWVNSGSGWSNSGTIETGEYRYIYAHSPLNFRNDRVDVNYAGYNFTSSNVHIGRTRGGRRTLVGHV